MLPVYVRLDTTRCGAWCLGGALVHNVHGRTEGVAVQLGRSRTARAGTPGAANDRRLVAVPFVPSRYSSMTGIPVPVYRSGQ